MSWGGAQWLIVFMLCVRAFIGLMSATGYIVIPVKTPETKAGKIGQYLGARLNDAALVAVLIWGGFWG